MKIGLTSTTRRTSLMQENSSVSILARPEVRLPASRRVILGTTAEAPNPRRERNAAETKKRILQVAASEFAAKGFDGARLQNIARAAGVQQALIHHYFADKEGLHREVVRGGLEAMTQGVLELLPRMDAPAKKSKARSKKRRSVAELRAIAEAFVDVLLRFFASNGDFLAILRHEARRDADSVTKIVAENVAPVFDGIVAKLDGMKKRGDVRKDLDTRHFVLSCVAMVAFPFQEEVFVAGIWPANWYGTKLLEERKKHVVEMILARIAP